MNIKTLSRLLLLYFSLCRVANAALPIGNSTWVYDVNATGAPTAMWSNWVDYYNSFAAVPHNLSTVYSYGGDMEINGTALTTYFPVANQHAAMIYKGIPGVKSVILTVDGQMNGGQSYSPDLSKLTPAQVRSWADSTAQLYCAYSFVDGLQIDLEPATPPYLANLLVFYRRLSADLLLTTNNCVDSAHPTGRTIGVFMSAGSATPAVFQAIGANGYVIMSGYDLGTFAVPTVPATYGLQLTAALKLLALNAAASHGSFVIGIPAAASTTEFSQYIPASGADVFGYPMYSSTASNYATEALAAIQANIKSNPGYLGTALWGFSLYMENPKTSGNYFYPAIPFDQAGEIGYFQANL
jgi:hypothetical protein